MDEHRQGSVARGKPSFHEYVSSRKEDIFTGSPGTVMSKLNTVAEAIGIVLHEKLINLAEKALHLELPISRHC